MHVRIEHVLKEVFCVPDGPVATLETDWGTRAASRRKKAARGPKVPFHAADAPQTLVVHVPSIKEEVCQRRRSGEPWLESHGSNGVGELLM